MEDLEKKRARDKAYYEKNREKILARERAKYNADPEYFREKNKTAAERHRRNPDNTIKLRYLKTRYGLTMEQYQAMEVAQNGLCKICGGPPCGRWKRLHVDHDHLTNKVRGLLCFSCNTLLGCAKDHPGILEKAIAYLKD